MVIDRLAGGVVVGSDGLVVVVNQNHNSWSLPKGHIDQGETPREAAEREITEETGLTNLEYVSDLGSYRRRRIPLSENHGRPTAIREITMFLYRTSQAKLQPSDPDNPEARWVEINKVADLLTHPKDKDFFSSQIPKIKAGLGLREQ